MTKKTVKKRKVRRVVLGVGHPWFSGNGFTNVALTVTPVASSILLRTFEWKNLKIDNLGNWSKIRLVAEVIKEK